MRVVGTLVLLSLVHTSPVYFTYANDSLLPTRTLIILCMLITEGRSTRKVVLPSDIALVQYRSFKKYVEMHGILLCYERQIS